MGVVTDYENYEKMLIFGGISNSVGESLEEIKSSLSNKAFVVTLNSRQQTKSLFKEIKPVRRPAKDGRTSSQIS